MAEDLQRLFVECKACGLEFATPEEAEPHGPASFGPRILGNTIVYDCPQCGATASYGSGDFHFAQ